MGYLTGHWQVIRPGAGPGASVDINAGKIRLVPFTGGSIPARVPQSSEILIASEQIKGPALIPRSAHMSHHQAYYGTVRSSWLVCSGGLPVAQMEGGLLITYSFWA